MNLRNSTRELDAMTMDTCENFDVIVIGGGPAGSTVASFVAMQGHRVLLLERERFPRHQIGESLLPATVHGICSLLGLSEELAKQNFPRKRGGTFRWGKSPTPWTFTFAKNTDANGSFAYQVERARFDKLLLDNSRRKGVDVREEHRAEEILLDGERAIGVRFVDPGGVSRSASARYIVDAGGNGGNSGRGYSSHVGQRIHSEFFRNVALYGYFENARRLPAPNSGNILSCAFGEGWFWFIPLSDTLTSVGAVVSREASKIFKQGYEEAFNHLVKQCPLIERYLTGATRVTNGMYGEFRVRKDYSYCCTKFWAPGRVLIGDTACFIDPVFSSGVHLATYSALLAARSINTCLRDGAADEQACFEEFERRYRREYGNFYQFLTAFYDMHQDTNSYFWAARKVLNTEEQANEAFVRLIAGVSAADEPMFRSDEYFRSRVGLGDWFQNLMSSEAEGAIAAERVPEFDPSKFDPSQFMKGFTSEIVQLQVQAAMGEKRPDEDSLAPGGLIPSRDCFHWERPPISAARLAPVEKLAG
jgi:halogenation protein CepH